MAEYALIIGINYMSNRSLSTLKWAVNDAYEFGKVLMDPTYCGFSTDSVEILLEENATRDNIIKGITDLRLSVKESDTAILFFAGHGYSEYNPESGDPGDKILKYIVPYDTEVNNIDSKAIDFSFLAERFKQIHSKRLVVFLDCCYSGTAGGRSICVPGQRIGSNDIKDPSFLNSISGIGRVVISGCDANELARELDDLKHGIFSYYLIQGLKGPADIQEDGAVDLNELWTYLSCETTKKSSQKQHPVLAGMIQGPPFTLSLLKKAVLKPKEKDDLEYELCKKYNLQRVKITEDSSYESLGIEAAKYLDHEIRHNYKFSASCGKTLSLTISHLTKRDLQNVTMFPLNAFPSETVETIDSNFLTSLFKNQYSGGEVYALQLPNRLPDGTAAEARNIVENDAAGLFKRAEESNLFLFGIGNPVINANIVRVIEKANFTENMLKELSVVGEISFHLFDEDGQFIKLKADLTSKEKACLDRYYSQFFAFNVESLKDLAKSNVDFVAVAGGEDKHKAILGAIKAGLVKTLITDVNTANWLNKEKL